MGESVRERMKQSGWGVMVDYFDEWETSFAAKQTALGELMAARSEQLAGLSAAPAVADEDYWSDVEARSLSLARWTSLAASYRADVMRLSNPTDPNSRPP